MASHNRQNYRLNVQNKQKSQRMTEPEETATTLRKKTAQLVMAALADLRTHNGVSAPKIIDHINNEFAVPENDFKKYIVGVLQRGVAFGTIKEANGKFRIGDVMSQTSRAMIRRCRGPKNPMNVKKRRRKRIAACKSEEKTVIKRRKISTK